MVSDRPPAVKAVTLALAGVLDFSPLAAAAGFPGSRFTARPFVRHHPFFHHHRFFRGFVPFGALGSTVVYVAPSWGCSDFYGYGSPCASYDPYSYYPPPVTHTSVPPGPGTMATVVLAPAPTQPPPPNVVEFPSGRYELRGDGMTVPYTWVWIPNPPSAPPSTAAPSASRNQLYRWTDEEGVLHATDRLEVVPPKYRSQAEQTPPL